MGGVGGTEGPAAPLGTRPSGEIFSGFARLSLRSRFHVFTEDDALPLRERECGYGSSEPSPTRWFQGHFQRNSQGAPEGSVAQKPVLQMRRPRQVSLCTALLSGQTCWLQHKYFHWI